MKYNPDKHHRHSIRLKGYDYSSPGAYFITLRTYQRQCLFGQIVDGEMQLNPFGQIVADEWIRSVEIRQEIDFDAWVIMPNHIHGIVVINAINDPNINVGAQRECQRSGIAYRRPKSLSSFVAGFKCAATKAINIRRNAAGTPVWQRNYYDRIIRNEPSLQRIRHYIQNIQNNPLTWQDDPLHPQVISDSSRGSAL